MYNIKTEKSFVTGDGLEEKWMCGSCCQGHIVVMGGHNGNYLKSVESFRFDRFTWEELPEMKEERYLASAEVLR